MPVFTGRNFIDIRIKGFLRRKRKPDILRAIERGMIRSARDSMPMVQRLTPTATGMLKRNHQINFRKSPRRVIITNPFGYVEQMESGRRVGRHPPPSRIRGWLRTRFGNTPRPPARSLDAAAFLVSRAIAREGIVVSPTKGLLHREGLGAMYRRTVATLGANFYGRAVVREIGRLR